MPKPPIKTTRVRILLCGQCEMGRHDHCTRSPACECSCKGLEVPPPQVTPEELEYARKVNEQNFKQQVGQPPADLIAKIQARMDEPNYVATGPTYGEVMRAPHPSVCGLCGVPAIDGKFPVSVSLCINPENILFIDPAPQPTPTGILVAYYELKEIRELKAVTEVRETILDLNLYITAPL